MEFTCPVCGEKFDDQRKLNRHLSRRHKGEIKLRIMEHPEKPKKDSETSTSDFGYS